MKVWSISILLLLFAGLSPACAQDLVKDVPVGCELIGIVAVNNESVIDENTMHSIDTLVGKLKKIGPGKVVKIEGHDALATNRDDHVLRSLNLAKEVEKYIRQKHKLPFDLYIGARDAEIEQGSEQFVRIIVYPEDFREIKI